MGSSEWIALGALLVATFALVRGEWRARAERKAREEVPVVGWLVTWPSKEAIVVTSTGPDDALNVLVQLTLEGVTVRAKGRRLRDGQSLSLPVPHLAELWDTTQLAKSRTEGVLESTHLSNVVMYGGFVRWKTPLGNAQSTPFDSAIQDRFPDIAPRIYSA